MKKRKNLLLLTEYFPVSEEAETTGGVEARIFDLVKGLSHSYKITVLCSRQPGQPKEAKVFGARVLRPGPIIPYSSKGFLVRRILTVLAIFLKGLTLKPDIVEGCSFMMYWQAFLIGIFTGAKKCATWHETWIGEWIKNKGILTGTLGSMWERVSIKLSWDCIISISNSTKKRLLERGVTCKNITVIPNGFNYAHLENISAKKNHAPSIVFLGRLTPQKDVGTLLYAVKEITKQINDIQCHIVGGGPCEKELTQLSEQLGIQKNIIFYGHQEKKADYLRKGKQCHIFVSPSLLEGFGIALLDAMAMGLPVVVSDIEPFKEVTHNGKGGFIFKQKDYKDLARKAVILLTNKKVYVQKCIEAKKLAATYDWHHIIKLYEQVYTKVLS